MEIFKWLLREKSYKTSIDRSETKKKQNGEYQGTPPNRMEIFTWWLGNGMDEMDIDAVRTEDLI